jgi:hypothetical protein
MVLLCSAAKAQIIIPKLGMSLSHPSLSSDAKDPGETIQNGIGIVGGIGLELPIKGKFAIQPELLFAQKAFKDKLIDATTGYSLKTTSTLNYLEIPVLVKAKFSSFYVNAGPSLGIGVGGKWKYTFSDGTGSQSGTGQVKFKKAPENDNSDNLYVDHRFNFSLQVGAGYVIAEKVIIDLRYGFGLSNLSADGKSKIRSFQVTVGVPIKLGK